MKRISIILLMLGGGYACNAQGVGEWLRQNSTQRKYLIKQIAALQAQIQQVKKGYDICREGYQTITHITKGEWDLHAVFLQGLKVVNPAVRNAPEVAAAIDLQMQSLRYYSQIQERLHRSTYVPELRRSRLADVANNIRIAVESNTDDLKTVLSNGKLELSDDARLKRIGEIYASSQTHRDAMLSLYVHLQQLAIRFQKDRAEIEGLQSLFKN